MARRRRRAALVVSALVAASAILAASGPGMAPATGRPAAVAPIAAVLATEARPTDPHDLSTFDRQLQPGAMISGLTAVTR
jgi:hypothetical protein